MIFFNISIRTYRAVAEGGGQSAIRLVGFTAGLRLLSYTRPESRSHKFFERTVL